MKITNQELQILIGGLASLSQLKTGPKISYNAAYTLKSAGKAWEIIESLRVPLSARAEAEPETVSKEWAELMAMEVEFEARPVTMEQLEGCVDAEQITASLLLQLGDFII